MELLDNYLEFFKSNRQYHPTSQELAEVYVNDHYQLERLATQYKKSGDWGSALACLYSVKTELEEIDDYHYFNIALRLSLYLQEAGMFEESKFELQSLVDELDYIAELQNMHHSDKEDYQMYIESSRYIFLWKIFDTARKIYKRERLNDEAKQFEKYSLFCRERHQEYSDYFSEQRSRRVKEYSEQRELRRKQDEEHKQEQALSLSEINKRYYWWSIGVGMGLLALIKYLLK